MARKVRSVYVCQACGAQAARWFGRCGGCGAWNTCVEEQPRVPDARALAAGPAGAAALLQPISAVPAIAQERLGTGAAELDRALGGGIMPGSAVLVGGDPGIGKSTLLLQMAGQVAAGGLPVAYVSAEESGGQLAQRARRLGAVTDGLLVMAETRLTAIMDEVRRVEPGVIIIDSIQTIYDPALESAPGSVRCV